MTSTHEKLRATAADNTRLLKIISETDYAPSALQQSNKHIANLKKDVIAQEKLLTDTKRTIAKEEAEHKQYQTSHVKRLAYRLGGKKEKFEQRASKEEQDWVDAVHRGFECQKKLDLLNRNLAEATSTSAEMERVAATYQQAQQELDQLYKSVFEGPTPDVPGEDERESAVYQATARHDAAQTAVEQEKRIQGLLTDALKYMDRAALDVEDARSNAKMDAFGFDSMFMEVAEANALNRVRQHVGQADMLVSQANYLRPGAGDLGNVVHAQHNFVQDVLFDNVFSDMAKYEKIKESQVTIMRARNNLKASIQQSGQRLEAALAELRDTKQAVDEKRLELQQIRAEAYLRANGETVAPPEGPPPDYRAAPPEYRA